MPTNNQGLSCLAPFGSLEGREEEVSGGRVREGKV